jgi:hypothetical protein
VAGKLAQTNLLFSAPYGMAVPIVHCSLLIAHLRVDHS